MNGVSLLYGCDTGHVGVVNANSNLMKPVFTLDNTIDQGKKAGVAALHACMLYESIPGVPEVVVGRDDGTVEVWSIDERNNHATLLHDVVLDESIRGLSSGHVVSADHQDLVVSTYSGNVIAFSTNPAGTNELHIKFHIFCRRFVKMILCQ